MPPNLPPDAAAPDPRRRRWQLARRIAGLVFLALVAWLLVDQARHVEWDQVGASLRRLPATTIALAAGLAALSYALYSCFDLVGRHVVGHRLGVRQVMSVTFVCYAFNLNLGSLVGSVALRYRLYSRLGLSAADTTRVLTLSLVTNWFGYLMLGGLVFLWRPMDLPPGWALDARALRGLGAVMVGLALAYLALCAFARRRRWTWRGHEIALPSARVALLQLAMGMTNWALIGTIVWLLLQRALPYTEALSVLLVAAIAGMLTHVPAGLGVLEAVFVALLGHELGRGPLIGALLAYRGVYYLAPLAVATLAYLAVEAHAKRLARESPPPPGPGPGRAPRASP